MAVTLTLQNLAAMPDSVELPNYSRQDLSPGIVHIGVGNFHRAHLATYLHQLMLQGEAFDWGIIGSGVKVYDENMRAKLQQQDWLSTVIELDNDNSRAHVLGSMLDFTAIEPNAIIQAVCDSRIRIVSLTITEGGYYLTNQGEGFNIEHPDIQQDIAHFAQPRSIFGILLQALNVRRKQNLPGVTLLSCDNIPHNGDVTKRIFWEMAEAVDPELKTWIEREVSFPNSMVDCIATTTTPENVAMLADTFGVNDQCPVFCEPFRQWVLEDNFVAGRPAFEKAGVQFVQDVSAYELMKLRILNGGHAAIAYPAALLGYTLIGDAMQNPLIVDYFKKLAEDDVIPTLPDLPYLSRQDYLDYSHIIVQRFSNTGIRDTIARLAMDASNRLPKFVLPTVHANLATNNVPVGLSLVLALWCFLLAQADSNAIEFEVVDEQKDVLTQAARQSQTAPEAFLHTPALFGILSGHTQFVEQFVFWINKLWQEGTTATLKHYLQ